MTIEFENQNLNAKQMTEYERTALEVAHPIMPELLHLLDKKHTPYELNIHPSADNVMEQMKQLDPSNCPTDKRWIVLMKKYAQDGSVEGVSQGSNHDLALIVHISQYASRTLRESGRDYQALLVSVADQQSESGTNLVDAYVLKPHDIENLETLRLEKIQTQKDAADAAIAQFLTLTNRE